MVSAFLNLALFVGVFYLILLWAGLPDRRRNRPADDAGAGTHEKRVA